MASAAQSRIVESLNPHCFGRALSFEKEYAAVTNEPFNEAQMASALLEVIDLQAQGSVEYLISLESGRPNGRGLIKRHVDYGRARPYCCVDFECIGSWRTRQSVFEMLSNCARTSFNVGGEKILADLDSADASLVGFERVPYVMLQRAFHWRAIVELQKQVRNTPEHGRYFPVGHSSGKALPTGEELSRVRLARKQDLPDVVGLNAEIAFELLGFRDPSRAHHERALQMMIDLPSYLTGEVFVLEIARSKKIAAAVICFFEPNPARHGWLAYLRSFVVHPDYRKVNMLRWLFHGALALGSPSIVNAAELSARSFLPESNSVAVTRAFAALDKLLFVKTTTSMFERWQ